MHSLRGDGVGLPPGRYSMEVDEGNQGRSQNIQPLIVVSKRVGTILLSSCSWGDDSPLVEPRKGPRCGKKQEG